MSRPPESILLSGVPVATIVDYLVADGGAGLAEAKKRPARPLESAPNSPNPL